MIFLSLTKHTDNTNIPHYWMQNVHNYTLNKHTSNQNVLAYDKCHKSNDETNAWCYIAPEETNFLLNIGQSTKRYQGSHINTPVEPVNKHTNCGWTVVLHLGECEIISHTWMEHKHESMLLKRSAYFYVLNNTIVTNTWSAPNGDIFALTAPLPIPIVIRERYTVQEQDWIDPAMGDTGYIVTELVASSCTAGCIVNIWSFWWLYDQFDTFLCSCHEHQSGGWVMFRWSGISKFSRGRKT